LEGKVTLITGTAGGIGRAAALLFAKEGAKVIGCDLKVEEARETTRMVNNAGGEMVSDQPVDLSDGIQAERWIASAFKTYGCIDILYNNASGPRFATIDRMTGEEWHSAIRNELDLVYWTCHYAWPYLKASGHGVIVNTASVCGMVGYPGDFLGNFAHAATKGGIIALTRQLAIEGAVFNIRANAVAPGFTVTPATEPLLQNPAQRESRLQMVPLGRLGQAEDVAQAALFLASDESSYITGTTIVVDGGYSAK
jgi:meso-butanediol dehydrogenase / (S,S)-butanediol dehydrogenase / diacetyl reductase